jgi:hypothetical protein
MCIDPPLPKSSNKFEIEEKKKLELVRRWRVSIKNIEITNTSGKVIDPFV